MKIFLDTAIVEEIRAAASWGVVDGVTTNPTLIAKSGRKFEEVVAEICSIVDGPVSAEVTAEDASGMVREAQPLAALHKNVVIKIPMTAEGLKATHASSSRASGPTSPSSSARPRRCWPPRRVPPSSRPSWVASTMWGRRGWR